jgi:subtilisin family serine protease
MRRALLVQTLLAGLLCAVPMAPRAAVAKDDSEPTWTVVLGKTQLLGTPKGFPEFCAANEDAKRSTLRRTTVAQLKELAAKERPAILAALGDPPDARPLWLVNAVVARLTPPEAEAAREHDCVLWTYPAGLVPDVPPKGKTDKVKEVLKRRKRKRRKFSARKKAIPWHLQELQVPEVWKELGVTGEGVLVAMFDAGINYRHEDVKGNVWINPKEKANNRKDDDGNGYVDDLYGYNFARMSPEVLDRSGPAHGAITSGCVAGDGTGGTVTGAAPRARLMALVAQGGPYNAARAFQYALEHGADVVNMSFSIPNLGDTRGLWRRLAEHATAAGLVMVSGAGNFGQQAQIPVQIRIPEGIPCVVCIGGVDRELQVPAFVSKGPVEWSEVKFYEDHPMPDGLVKPDVCAFPGPGVVLLRGSGKGGYLGESNTKRGNSLSAPQASGVIALMLSANPELTPWRVKAILEATALDLEAVGKDPRTGAGLVNAFEAVKAAKTGQMPPPR